jgi:hypothetical protein
VRLDEKRLCFGREFSSDSATEKSDRPAMAADGGQGVSPVSKTLARECRNKCPRERVHGAAGVRQSAERNSVATLAGSSHASAGLPEHGSEAALHGLRTPGRSRAEAESHRGGRAGVERFIVPERATRGAPNALSPADTRGSVKFLDATGRLRALTVDGRWEDSRSDRPIVARTSPTSGPRVKLSGASPQGETTIEALSRGTVAQERSVKAPSCPRRQPGYGRRSPGNSGGQFPLPPRTRA